MERAGAGRHTTAYRDMLEGAERDIRFRMAAGRYEAELNGILDALGLTMLVWTKGTGLTVYAARKTEGAYREPRPLYAGERNTPYLPQDTRRAIRDQPSHSGMVFNPEIRKQGNPPKRTRLLSLAQGAWSTPMPSRFPFLEIPAPPYEARIAGHGTLRVEELDTSGRGDGTGMVREQVGRTVILRSGASLKGDIIGIQVHFWGADYAFKGVFLFQPDHRFPDGVDWVIDKDSFNNDVFNLKNTEAKIAPWRHKSNKRYFTQDPVFLGETAMSDVDSLEVAQVNFDMAKRLDAESWERALCTDQRPVLRQAHQTHEIGYRKQRDLVGVLKEEREIDMMLTAYEYSGGSVHALPDLMQKVTGGVHGHWSSKYWDFQRNRPSSTPAIMVSGETVTLMSPEYAGVPVPREGYIGFVRHPRREDQIIGAVMHPADDRRSKAALDGQDYDGDKVSFTLRQKPRCKARAKVMRSPQSIGGGYTLKVEDEDAEWLRELGYHFYRMTGGDRYPGLHEIRGGERVVPDVLEPVPYKVPPRWGTDPADAVKNVLKFARHRRVIGQITNAENNLDSAGHYDPKVHKLNRSDHIDADLHADKDPSGTPNELLGHLHSLVMAGKPMDPCFYDRVERQLQELHERTGDKRQFPRRDQVKMQCPEWHNVAKKSMEDAVKHLKGMADTRLLTSNGPLEWLISEEYPEELITLVRRVLRERFQAWSRSGRAKSALKRDRKMDNQTRKKNEDWLDSQTRGAEMEAIRQGYEEAREIPGHRDGRFMAAYILASIRDSNRIQRWSQGKRGMTSRKTPWKQIVTTRALTALPVEEHRGYFGRGRTAPTAIVRTKGRLGAEHQGKTCRIRPETRGGKTLGYNLVGEDGNVLIALEGGPESEGMFHVHELTVLGYLPDLGPDMKEKLDMKANPEIPWMQIPNQLALEQKMRPRDYFRTNPPEHGRKPEQEPEPGEIQDAVPWTDLPQLVVEQIITPRNFLNPVLSGENLVSIMDA